MNNQPIGVLDSGVGGLTVLKEIQKQLPRESTLYIGDSKNAPYGKRTPENIRELATKLIQFLVKKDVKLIVVACNTITVNGIEVLREAFPSVPIIGTVPVVKMAAALTKAKKIGLLVTSATAKSAYNMHLIEAFSPDCEVITIGTDKLVPLIETQQQQLLPEVIARELQPFKEKGVDVVILGSTHFPILRNQIENFLGKDVRILDSGGAIARQVKKILTNNNDLSSLTRAEHGLYTTGDLDPFLKIAQRVLDKKVNAVTQVVLQ